MLILPVSPSPARQRVCQQRAQQTMNEESQQDPKTPKRKHFTRDDLIRAQTLRGIGWTYLDATIRQIQTACVNNPTPKKHSGRLIVLTKAQIQQLINFISSSQAGCQMSFI